VGGIILILLCLLRFSGLVFVCVLSFIICLGVLVLFVFFMPMRASSSLVFYFFVRDETALLIVYITCFIVFISIIIGLNFKSHSFFLSLIFILVFCLFVFSSYSMFFLYLFYEASLVPILYIIIKWGSYPERSLSSIMLLVYTSVFTFPFLYIIFKFYFSNFTFVFNLVERGVVRSSFLFRVIIFFTFAVKLPVYGLHYWLPMAHVEAPTFGSILLAGVLLKLGGAGLIRFSPLIALDLLKSVFLGYLLVLIVFVTLVCCIQSDFKRLVAYSSVSHIISIPIFIFRSSLVGLKGLLVVMFMHGISSPLLFMFVGVVYSLTSTRQHVLLRGFIISSPLISFFIVLTFFFTLSAPPFPSFISEVFFVTVSIGLWFKSIIFLLFFLLLSLVYNLL